MSTNETSKKSGGSRVQVRLQEFVKKLHPDALRNRFRNFRKFVISSTEKRSQRDEATASITKLPYDCDTSMSSQHQKNADCDKHDDKRLKPTLKLTNVPEVVIPDDVISQNDANEQSPRIGNNLQLAINMDTTPRNKSPITVQEWVDSLPLTPTDTRDEVEAEPQEAVITAVVDTENDNLTLGAEAGHLCDTKPTPAPPINVTITSCQEPSEVESHCSSVDSLLEARKPDPEEVLLSLGFGGTASSSYLETGRIPKRFLNQSQLKGVDIEEFIRQQQDLIYTFESGYYGYRGLAGPSHSNPSVIVAKILEKLREHEKETTSMTSYRLDFRKPCSLEKNTRNSQNKFSKVARNVLTKIRCTPGSVLSPDNRKWLDSQGSKSPEIARRLILGQKSFTFGRDGDLIEASTPDKEDDKQITLDKTEDSVNDEDESNPHVPDSSVDSVPEQTCNFNRRFTDSSTDMSVESMIMKSDLHEISNRTNMESTPRSTLKRLNPVDIDEPSLDMQQSNNQECPRNLNSSLPECETNTVPKLSHEVSLLDELKDSGVPLNFDPERSSIKKLKNILTRYSSFEESCRDSDDDVNENRSISDYQSSEKADQYADSATESEFAAYSHRSFTNKNVQRQYEELTLLESKLHSLGRPLTVISEDQFSSITTEQRCALQTQIIREALEVYLHQLTEDEMHLELKNCLSAEAQKVADLLDSSSDTSKLSIIVRQMTLLLQHQSQLSAQIKELSVVDKKPLSCHEMCDHILKRVHELELLVQQNAQELAQMKYQLLNKNNF